MADVHPFSSQRGSYAVRIYGRRWLRMTPKPAPNAIGHRVITWTKNLAEAEKWNRREAAERFAERAGFEVVDLEAVVSSPA
jgi:hypothetical protein